MVKKYINKRKIVKKKYIKHAKVRKARAFLKPVITLLSLIFCIFILWFFIFRSTLFTVIKINIDGADKYINTSDLYTMVSNNALHKKFFVIDMSKLKANLSSNFKGAKQINLNFASLNTLNVRVVERVPLAVVYNNNDKYFMVDEDGYVLGAINVADTKLPLIKYEGDIQIGSFINKRMVPIYLELIDLLNTEHIEILNMSFTSDYAKIITGDFTEVLISNEKDKKKAVITLVSLLRQLSLEGKNARRIDLRYDKVIVSYN